MNKKKMAIIGIGGRTGTMFAFELRNSADVLGIGREKEVSMIREKKFYVEKKIPEPFEEKTIKDVDFNEETRPDIIFLTTKNPVTSPIKYYYQKIGKKIPTLLISQNGIVAISEAKQALKVVLGKASEKARIVRIILFNPVDKRIEGDEVYIKYSLPIRIVLSKVSGEGKIEDIVKIFKAAGFEVKEFSSKEAKNLEFSKLFLNLIGMAAASRRVSIKEGFSNQEIFKEEVEALKEYIKVVKASGGKFLNFPHYPVRFLTILLGWLPMSFLLPLKNIITNFISRRRGGKPKDLDEIDYYNGAVVNLGEKIGVKTPINEKIYKRALEKLSSGG